MAFARSVDVLATQLGPETRQEILARETKVTKTDVPKLAKIAKASPKTAKHVMEAIQQAPTPKKARVIVAQAVTTPHGESQGLLGTNPELVVPSSKCLRQHYKRGETTMAIAAPTMDDTAFFHRWLAGGVRQDYPELPEAILEAFCAADGALTAETLALACALPLGDAAGWCRLLAVQLDLRYQLADFERSITLMKDATQYAFR